MVQTEAGDPLEYRRAVGGCLWLESRPGLTRPFGGSHAARPGARAARWGQYQFRARIVLYRSGSECRRMAASWSMAIFSPILSHLMSATSFAAFCACGDLADSSTHCTPR